MKGLILNNFYTIEKSVKSSIILSIAAVIILVMTEHDMALRAALFLPFFLIPVHGFEVLKHDAMSGWNIFETTLPVTREQIVRSKYSTFLLLLVCSFLIIVVIFFTVDRLFFSVIDQLFFNFLLRGMGLILCLAAATFALTYKLGTEKSDSITLGSAAFTFGMFFGLSTFLGTVFEHTRIDEIFSVTFLGLAVTAFMISYVFSVYIYKRQEF